MDWEIPFRSAYALNTCSAKEIEGSAFEMRDGVDVESEVVHEESRHAISERKHMKTPHGFSLGYLTLPILVPFLILN